MCNTTSKQDDSSHQGAAESESNTEILQQMAAMKKENEKLEKENESLKNTIRKITELSGKITTLTNSCDSE